MQLLLTTKRHFSIALWMPVRFSTTTPAFLNECGRPCVDVSAESHGGYSEHLLQITLSAITQKLNVSGLINMAFFLVLACGTHAQSLSATFIYTLYKTKHNVWKKWIQMENYE
jgi:hypothetical protein